jgi:hypothetical protein
MRVREYRRSIGALRRSLMVAALLWLGMAVGARASVTLLLEQPYGKLNIFLPEGHSAIYLDRVCAATPLKLRMCRPGEMGVVISRYNGVGNHDWAAVPLIPYLYAVDTAEEIPQNVDREQVRELRDSYRRRSLESLAPDGPEGTTPDGNWYELAGSAYDRTTYGFRGYTSEAQDRALVAFYNDRRNTEEYNGVYRNCADFARVILNFYYPHAVRRNWVANVGITSPKSVARSLAHYANKHPRVELDVFKIQQVDGSLPRSHRSQDIGEGLLKRYGLPMVALSVPTTAVVLVAYISHGRYTVPKDVPLLDIGQLQAELEHEAEPQEPEAAVGDQTVVAEAGALGSPEAGSAAAPSAVSSSAVKAVAVIAEPAGKVPEDPK